jgi:aspartate/methionine/tyrosine aminotransferase
LERAGQSVIHLEIGEPDFTTPQHIIASGVQALRDGMTHYTPTAGIVELREAIAADYEIRKGVKADPQGVVVVPGGKPIIFYTVLALVNPGDEVIIPDPGFPVYESVVRLAGGVPVPLPITEENDFRLRVEDLQALIGPRTKLLILNSPANPTGGVLTQEDLQGIAQCVAGKNIFVLADEIYDEIVYEGTAPSLATIDGMQDWTIILNGFSKTYAMTGWRIGYGIMHPEIAEQVALLLVNSCSCTAAFTQVAGLQALQGPHAEVEEMVAEFRRRRDLVVDGLNAIPGISCRRPKGAFYAFPNIRATGLSSQELADALLEEAGVATLSGTAFGQYGEGYLRISYANSIPNLEQALARIADLLRIRFGIAV